MGKAQPSAHSPWLSVPLSQPRWRSGELEIGRGKATPKNAAAAFPKITFAVLTLRKNCNKSQIHFRTPCCGTRSFLLTVLGPCASPAIPIKVMDEGGGTAGISGAVSVEQSLHFGGAANASRFPWQGPRGFIRAGIRQSCASQQSEQPGCCSNRLTRVKLPAMVPLPLGRLFESWVRFGAVLRSSRGCHSLPVRAGNLECTLNNSSSPTWITA